MFAVKFDPRLQSISTIQTKYWRAIVAQEPYLSECIPEPPLTAYKRPKNIREYLIRAKVPLKPDSRLQRLLKGMQKYKDQCTACPYILEGKNTTIINTSTRQINRKLTCNSYNIIYILVCKKDNCKS